MALRLDRRSFICTPAISTDRFAAARACGADVGLVDLEDSVPGPLKESARALAERYFEAPAPPGTVAAVRINSPGTPDGLRDLLAVAGYRVGPQIVLVPKAESARDIDIVAGALDRDDYRPELYAIVETPRALARLAGIAGSRRLGGMVFGAADYALGAGCALTWEALLFARSAIAAAAAAAGVAAIDSPCFAVDDQARVRAEAVGASALGYCGKIAVHPRQVAVLNKTFRPSSHEVARARDVVAAAERTGTEIAVAGGQMVGPPFFAAAAELLRLVDVRERADAEASAGAGRQDGGAR